MQLPFNDLKPESVGALVTKYVKMVTQLEKGLPPNGVVPKLKAKVKTMQEKVMSAVLHYSINNVLIFPDACHHKPS